MAEIKPLVSPWFPMTDTNSVRALGKTLEELGECVSAVSRCLIQGIDEKEPVTGKLNREWLMEEMADVKTQFAILEMHFNIDRELMEERESRKFRQMLEWRAML